MDENAINRAIKIQICNIYHGCVHNMLHEMSEDILKGLYKSAAFVIQAITFKQTGKYIRSQSDLLQIALPEEQRIINTSTYLKNGGAIDFEKMSQELFVWSKAWIGKAY